jgi:hypothetical protein
LGGWELELKLKLKRESRIGLRPVDMPWNGRPKHTSDFKNHQSSLANTFDWWSVDNVVHYLPIELRIMVVMVADAVNVRSIRRSICVE